MAIALKTEALPARTTKAGSDTFTVAAGKHLIVETSPQGVEFLDVEVPAGKTWTVTVNVYIQES